MNAIKVKDSFAGDCRAALLSAVEQIKAGGGMKTDEEVEEMEEWEKTLREGGNLPKAQEREVLRKWMAMKAEKRG